MQCRPIFYAVVLYSEPFVSRTGLFQQVIQNFANIMALTPERQALLKQKGDEYVASMEQSGRGIAYNQIETDRLLILEAVNDWSGRALGEGGEIQFTYGCDDPCCATEDERSELVRRLHKNPVILYPVSGFSLSDKDELRFGYQAASFRMTPHTNDSRTDGIGIAEAQHIRDVEAAVQLWTFCATEDCMAYLYHYMDSHNLFLEDEEKETARRIVTSALQDHFSIGQIWNAMWRSVKDAAALSTRQYYNNAKAAKTIPKKIDKVLAGSDPSFESYDRIADTPMGALLTLFNHRFGINDATTGSQVRARLAADAALAPPAAVDAEEVDESRTLVQGTLFFRNHFTELDRLVLSCLKGLKTEAQEPEWDEGHVIGQLHYSLESLYAFDDRGFINKLFSLMRVSPPSSEDIARHAASAKEHNEKTGEYADRSGWTGALSEALEKGGIEKRAADRISWVLSYEAPLEDIVGIVRYLPIEAGLCAIRDSYAYIDAAYKENFDRLRVGDFTFAIPEEHLEPDGCDRDIVVDVVEQNIDHLAELVASSIFFHLVYCQSEAQKAEFLTLVANKLLEQTKSRLIHSGVETPDRS